MTGYCATWPEVPEQEQRRRPAPRLCDTGSRPRIGDVPGPADGIVDRTMALTLLATADTIAGVIE